MKIIVSRSPNSNPLPYVHWYKEYKKLFPSWILQSVATWFFHLIDFILTYFTQISHFNICMMDIHNLAQWNLPSPPTCLTAVYTSARMKPRCHMFLFTGPLSWCGESWLGQQGTASKKSSQFIYVLFLHLVLLIYDIYDIICRYQTCSIKLLFLSLDFSRGAHCCPIVVEVTWPELENSDHMDYCSGLSVKFIISCCDWCTLRWMGHILTDTAQIFNIMLLFLQKKNNLKKAMKAVSWRVPLKMPSLFF